jgi:cysteine desulfurase/selenocysteine lyase
LAFNGSKWLCGPMGTGLFYCKKSSSDLLDPISIGGESAMIYDETKLAFKEIPEKFQTGFRNYVGMVGLESSVRYLTQFGIHNIRSKIMKLANQLRDELLKISGVTMYGPEEPEKRTSIISFNIKGLEPQTIVEKLEKQKIVLAVREIFNKKISFNIKGLEPQTIVEKLEKQKIVLAVREIFNKKLVRVSPHLFNTESEIQTVIDAIKKL